MDKALFIAGFFSVVTWFVAAVIPLFRRPRFYLKGNQVVWAISLSLSIAIFIAGIIIGLIFIVISIKDLSLV